MTRIYRSRTDRKITGLCGGLSDTLGIDATLLRLIVVATTFFSGGIVIPLYFLAALVIPSEPWNGGPYGPDPGYAGHHGGGCGHKWGHHFGEHFGHQFGNWKDWKRAERHYRKAQRYGWTPPHEHNAHDGGYTHQAGTQADHGSNLDDMMKDIEKKAMWKEIEELRAKVKQYEKQQQSTKGDV